MDYKRIIKQMEIEDNMRKVISIETMKEAKKTLYKI